MTETKIAAQDVLEWLKNFDFCPKCDALGDNGEGFMQDRVIEELERLRARVRELEAGQESTQPRVRLLIAIECDREQVPGWGYAPQDMADAAARHATALLGCYSPRILAAAWTPVNAQAQAQMT